MAPAAGSSAATSRSWATRANRRSHILANGRLNQGWNGRVNGRVLALAVVGGTLYVGGDFTQAGSGPGPLLPASRVNFAAFDAATGGLKTTSAGGADAIVTALAVSGTTLYAGGDFVTFGAQGRTRLAAYDTTNDTVLPWNPGADGTVREIVPAPGGVFIGGAFGNAGQLIARVPRADRRHDRPRDGVESRRQRRGDGADPGGRRALRGRALHAARRRGAQSRRRGARADRRTADVGSERRRRGARVLGVGYRACTWAASS